MTGDDRTTIDERSAVVRNLRRSILALIALIAVILGLAVWRFSPLAPGPAVPVGASPLHVVTEAPHLVPTLGCPMALLAPVRLQVSGDDLITVSVESGEPVSVVWASGWVAWRVSGKAELHGRDGSLIASEGDVIADRFGGGVGTGDVFHVCVAGG